MIKRVILITPDNKVASEVQSYLDNKNVKVVRGTNHSQIGQIIERFPCNTLLLDLTMDNLDTNLIKLSLKNINSVTFIFGFGSVDKNEKKLICDWTTENLVDSLEDLSTQLLCRP